MTELEVAQQQRIAELEEKLAETQRQLDLLVRQIFGRKSEQTPAPVPGQMDLELQAENAAIESAPPAKAGAGKGGSRKGRKVRAALLPENLPVEETMIIPLAVQAAPEKLPAASARKSWSAWSAFPAGSSVLRLVRPTFVSIDAAVCRAGDRARAAGLVQGGFFGPQFMADMVLGKYLYHLPLYRQAKGIEMGKRDQAFAGDDVSDHRASGRCGAAGGGLHGHGDVEERPGADGPHPGALPVIASTRAAVF